MAFVAEGPKIINDLLGAYINGVETIFATSEWIAAHTIQLKNIAAEKIIEVKQQELERISFLQTPNEVLAVFKKPVEEPLNFSSAISLMLDEIQDPGNMGTIIRIADWFGIKNIVCSTDCADAFAPKVIQSTMGSIARIKIMYADILEIVKQTSLPLYAATLNGTTLKNMQPIKEGIIVIGNESKGIHAELLHHCAHKITISRIGEAESLNAGGGYGYYFVASDLVKFIARLE